MASRAVDIEALLASNQRVPHHRKRKHVHAFAAGFSGVEMLVGIKLAAGHHSLHKRACGAFIAEECALLERLVARLVRHLLLATRHKEEADRDTAPRR